MEEGTNLYVELTAQSYQAAASLECGFQQCAMLYGHRKTRCATVRSLAAATNGERQGLGGGQQPSQEPQNQEVGIRKVVG